MTLETGDLVLHLQHGLARVVALKSSPLPAAIVRIEATQAEHWVPLSAAGEHVAKMPRPDAARAWLASVVAPAGFRPPGGDEAAEARARTLEYRDVDRQLEALRDAYRSGDRGASAERAREDLEARLLPVIAAVLGRSAAELSAELREGVPALEVAPMPTAVPDLDGLETLGRAELTGETLVGEAPARVRTRPGPWIGYVWRDGYSTCLLAVHEEHVASWRELRRELAVIGTTYANGGSALIYQASMLDHDADADLLYSRDGVLDGRGFAFSLGGDGDYQVRGVERDGALVCVAGSSQLDAFREAQLRGMSPLEAALAACAHWRAAFVGDLDIELDVERDRDEADMLRRALEVLRATDDPSAVIECERVRALIDAAEPEQVSPWLAQARAVLP